MKPAFRLSLCAVLAGALWLGAGPLAGQDSPLDRTRALRAAGEPASVAATHLRRSGLPADETAALLREGYRIDDSDGIAALRAAGYPLREVYPVLDGGRRASDEETGRRLDTLTRGGFSTAEIVAFLRDGLRMTPEQAAAAMRSAGRTAEEIAERLREEYGLDADRAAEVLRGVGFDASEIAGALVAAFGAGAEAVAAVLRRLGYSAGEIAVALRDRLHKEAGEIAEILEMEGFLSRTSPTGSGWGCA